MSTDMLSRGAARGPANTATGDIILDVKGLSVGYLAGSEIKTVVSDLDIELRAGQILGLAGESGCGKSTASLASIGYPTPGARALSGTAMLGDLDLLALPLKQLRQIWGSRIAFVSQQATTSLNPSLTVGRHLQQTMSTHLKIDADASAARQLELLQLVDIPDPAAALKRYPFQFSGGQQQRIAIAIALACEPEILILDEPTTGLDVTTQARFSALLRKVVSESGVAALYVSHDLALLYSLADSVTVMYAGQAAESGSREVLHSPRHPYTEALLLAAPSTQRPGLIAGIPGRPPAAVVTDACSFAPRCGYAVDACRARPVPLIHVDAHDVRCIRPEATGTRAAEVTPLPRATPGEVLLHAENVWCTYRGAASPVVRDVTLSLSTGEVIGIVGESGSGKSTFLRSLAGLHGPSQGRITFRGKELRSRAVQRRRNERHELQLIFQNPDTSLNPRHTIEDLIARPIRLFRDDVSRKQERAVIGDLLEAVKLPRSVLDSYPSELSGGQKQRVAIARAFAAEPSVLLCDEITSALDVSVQATVLELLADLAVERDTAVVFVSHDLAVVRSIADRSLVMRRGEVVEEGSTVELFEHPVHEYTRTLLSSLPELPPMARRAS